MLTVYSVIYIDNSNTAYRPTLSIHFLAIPL